MIDGFSFRTGISAPSELRPDVSTQRAHLPPLMIATGRNLFWKQAGRDAISVTAGTLDTPTNLTMEQHIFVADKSDYYTINDDLPKHEQWQ